MIETVAVIGAVPKEPVPITIDQQEKQPITFRKGYAVVTVAHLKTFDYAVTGDEKWGIERKSIADLVGSFTSNRAREIRKIERARKQFDEGWPLLYLIDGSVSDLINYDWSRCKRATSQWFFSDLVTLHIKYDVEFHFFETRQIFALTLYRWLKSRWKHLKRNML